MLPFCFWIFIYKQIIGYDPITTAEEAKNVGIEKMELDEIWPMADYITVHTPLIPATRSEQGVGLFLIIFYLFSLLSYSQL